MLVLALSSLMHSLLHCIMLCFAHAQIIDRRVRELFVKADMLPLDTPANEIVKAGYKLVCMSPTKCACTYRVHCVCAFMHPCMIHGQPMWVTYFGVGS